MGIEAAGLVRGACHFAFETSGQSFPGDGPEAECFVAELRRAGGVKPGDLLALDIEDGSGELGDWCLRWLKRVEVLTGVHPLLYTGAWFSALHGLGAVPALAEYPLWLADYDDEWPGAPRPWEQESIWQYSDAGRVPGITGGVNMNQFPGPREQSLALGKPGSTPAPAPDAYIVGQGIRDLMTANGDAPASGELQFKRGDKDRWAEAFGQSGARYVYVSSLNRTFRYEPAA
ncbi:MAG: glycoside hydrolase family 25 protein [Chloroflexi bacterium]|nr:glycoside hydrolase family 25 protein [Chloroflexota bacterium]